MSVRTCRRVLVLGKSLRDFMARPGIYNDGRDPCRQLRDRMERLYSAATISLHYRGNHKSVRLVGVIGDKAVFWRNYGRLIPSEIRLSRAFIDSTGRQPVADGLNCLHALRRSTMDLDLCLWFTCLTFSFADPLALIWGQVYTQHGPFPDKAGDDLTVQNFRKKCLRELKKIKLAGRELNYSTELWRLILHPTPPPIPDERGPAPALECASDASTVLRLFSEGDWGAASLPKMLPCPTHHSGLWLPPVAHLALGPLGRRNPAARTLTLTLRAVCQHGLPMPPGRSRALGSASSSRSGLAGAASPG